MKQVELTGWADLRHGGLLLDLQRASEVAAHEVHRLSSYSERELRRQVTALLDGDDDISSFVSFVLQEICGFTAATGNWHRGSRVPSEWGRLAVTGEVIKPRHLWLGRAGEVLPVFLDRERRVGIGRGRKATSQVLQWLRAGDEQLALLTNGRQWRLIFAGLDFDAWCEWDVDLWFEEGGLSPQVAALRTLLSPALWTPVEDDVGPLLRAILDSRKGQSELSKVLGERVREAVEILVQGHGDVIKERCTDMDPADIYRAAVRVVMRMVVVLFAEPRGLLPQDNALYHGSYGLSGILEELERVAAQRGSYLARSFSAWPRMLSLFRLIHGGSHHPDLLLPAYGGELFAPGDPESLDGLTRALAVLETACFDREALCDRDVHQMLACITRTRVKVRQGRASTWVIAPVDFSGLSSEYIGILYEGLLDFELRTASDGDPIVFLAVGDQPALPLSRLEAMDDKAIKNLLEKLKDTSGPGAHDEETLEGPEVPEAEEQESTDASAERDDVEETGATEEADDERNGARSRAEAWARRAVEVGKLARRPRGKLTPEKTLVWERTRERKACQIVTRVVLPGEWYLVRWGGTRKGAGTFYTRPGLAVPTVQRTLRPLAYDPPTRTDGSPDLDAAAIEWTPKKPEDILALKVCDPACGSGSFPVAALRFLAQAAYASLHHHGRLEGDVGQPLNEILGLRTETSQNEGLQADRLPCMPDDDGFEVAAKARLRRYVVERCIYGVDLDPLAVELCRLALWVETMDRNLPFSFLDHKIKCGNSLVGAWFDQFQHYPAMAWKNREGGDKNHTNGVHFEKGARTKAIKAFVKRVLAPDLVRAITSQTELFTSAAVSPTDVHDRALRVLDRVHELPIQDSAERARIYRDELLDSEAYRSLKEAMNLWCACWFWPAEELDDAPLPSTLAGLPNATREAAVRIATKKHFFHWELEFPDVFQSEESGFDAMLGNPPWDIAKPNSKEFFSNLDPLYRSYGKHEALHYQTEYFADEAVELAWLDYGADFRALSNFTKYAAGPFGDPEGNDKSQNRFSISRGRANAELHARWRASRARSAGFADRTHPFRHQGSADINLYKLFLEQAHALLRDGGRLGLVVPSGLYSDYGTGGLRELFLDHCRWEWLFGFENRDAIFDTHRSSKFNPIVVQKGGRTEAIRTAFMRRRLEDWEWAELYATPYTRERVEQLSPRSRSILEIRSNRDLEVLEGIYANSVLLGDGGPDAWGIDYAREFDTDTDSKLFPPRTKWEEQGYRPDEYNRWLKGGWRSIDGLWEELGIEAVSRVALDLVCEASLKGADVVPGDHAVHSARPPYDSLPIPRADIPDGIILSRDADAFIHERKIAGVLLPLYEGRMIGQFDFSQSGWVSGRGRSAVWRDIPWSAKAVEPQFLMAEDDYKANADRCHQLKLSHMRVGSATNSRSAIGVALRGVPTSDTAAVFYHDDPVFILGMAAVFNSLTFDYVTRCRLVGLHLDYHVFDQNPLPEPLTGPMVVRLAAFSSALSLGTPLFSIEWLRLHARSVPRQPWALAPHERKRYRVMCDAVVAVAYGLNQADLGLLVKDCDRPLAFASSREASRSLDPKGFWRIDRDKDPELRHTVLTQVAFHDLQRKIEECGGDREKGIEVFCNQNDGEGWMLPETLRLADYGLGHDERAREHQPVASRLGPRFYDWQLAQTAEESWRECHLHARNLLGEGGYRQLLEDIEAEECGEKLHRAHDRTDGPSSGNDSKQHKLFE